MPDPLYNAVYTGNVIAPDQQLVIQKCAELFKIDMKQAQRIVAGGRRVLKRNLPRGQALAYVKKLSTIGMLAEIELCEPDIESLITLEPETPTTNASRKRSGESDEQAVDEERSDTDKEDDNQPSSQPEKKVAGSASFSVEPQEQAPQATNFAVIEDTSKVKRCRFEFSGNGFAYFRIWLVNVLLTVVTLGIYSAWAKVRTNRYFYQHTLLDGEPFEYLADPLAILRGRLLVVGFMIISVIAQWIMPLSSAVSGLLFLLILPWIVVQSLKYRMVNTAYRDIRFHFDGSYLGAFIAFSMLLLLVPVSVFLLFPAMIFLQYRYYVDNTRFGVDQFSFGAGILTFYRVFVLAGIAGVVLAFAAPLLLAESWAFGGIVIVLVYSLIVSFVKVEILNAVFDNAALGDHRFSSSLQLGEYFYLHLVNTVLIIASLGLFYPWAKVRLARYRAECTMVMTHGSLKYYAEEQSQEVSALGEGGADLLGLEIGL